MKALRSVLPPVLLLAFYWPALTGWFFQDDFGWLRLRQDVHSVSDLPAALFAPKAHGNMRPLGENAYWLVLGKTFGVNALPFHVVTFATEIAALLLVAGIAFRLTKSSAAGFAAPVLWIASCGLAPAMGWCSIYNQVLSGFFFLLAFYALLRHVETGERRWWVWQWVAFVAGLGALETNVVYPALAAVYALLYARPLLKKILPMFVVAALSAAIHFHFAPAGHTGPYAPRVDMRVFGTVAVYWNWDLGRMPVALAAALALVALAFAIGRAMRRDFAPLIGLAWFLVPLAPYLLLPEHRMDYYLAVPSIGLALFGAAVVARWPVWKLHWRALAAACLVCFVVFSGRQAWAITRWEHDRGQRVEDFVWAVAEIRRTNPGKAILLDGMDNDLFWAGMANLPFHAMRIPEVFLAPEGTKQIDAPADFLAELVLPKEVALRALRRDGAVVYRFDGNTLRNETNRYHARAEASFPEGTPHFINIGDPIFAEFLGSGWGPVADGYRPMRGTASLRVAGGSAIIIGVVRAGSFDLHLAVDGSGIPLTLASHENDIWVFRASLPQPPRPEVDLTLTTSLRGPLTFGFVQSQ